MGTSKLDGKEQEIRRLLKKQVSKASIANILGAGISEALDETPFYWMYADEAYAPTARCHRGDFTEVFAAERPRVPPGAKRERFLHYPDFLEVIRCLCISLRIVRKILLMCLSFSATIGFFRALR